MHFVKAKGILSSTNGMNLYRGCTHGCIYCDSRSACYQMKHAFEDVEVKENAIELLEDALKRKRKKCMLGLGSMSDPYMPLEQTLQYTRKTLQLAEAYGFGVTLITKSNLVLRDLDLLQALHNKSKCVVQMTLTTYDEALCQKLEPNVCTTKERFDTLCALRDAGIPTVVWLSPILPFINDTLDNVQGILNYCRDAKVYGVICFGMGVTLRDGNRQYFYRQLDRLFPGLKKRYEQTYGQQYVLTSPNNRELMQLYHQVCESAGIIHNNDRIFHALRTLENMSHKGQLCLFDETSL